MEQYSVQTVKDGSEVAEDLHSLGAWVLVLRDTLFWLPKDIFLVPPLWG